MLVESKTFLGVAPSGATHTVNTSFSGRHCEAPLTLTQAKPSEHAGEQFPLGSVVLYGGSVSSHSQKCNCELLSLGSCRTLVCSVDDTGIAPSPASQLASGFIELS